MMRADTIHGYSVYTANNGAEPLLIYKWENSKIAMVHTDILMPGITGKMLAFQAGRKKPGMKVVYMSGYPNDTHLCV